MEKPWVPSHYRHYDKDPLPYYTEEEHLPTCQEELECKDPQPNKVLPVLRHLDWTANCSARNLDSNRSLSRRESKVDLIPMKRLKALKPKVSLELQILLCNNADICTWEYQKTTSSWTQGWETIWGTSARRCYSRTNLPSQRQICLHTQMCLYVSWNWELYHVYQPHSNCSRLAWKGRNVGPP